MGDQGQHPNDAASGPSGLGERERLRERLPGAAQLMRETRGGQLTREYLPPNLQLWAGNRCQLLRDGVEAFPAMLDAIRGARRYVRLETYMFFDDVVGRLFAQALVEAAQRGVDVKVLYDALGSWTVPVAFYDRLRAQGVDIRAFKPFSWRGMSALVRRDHRKLLVVDGEVAFTGGINVAANWAPVGHGDGWRDDVLRVEGPAVYALERCFTASWRIAVQRRLHRLKDWLHRRHSVHQLARRGDSSLAVLSHRRAIYRSYLHAIEQAKRSVLIAAAYFVPDRRMVEALRQAAARGVEVRLILNGNSDHPWMQYLTRAFYDRLMEKGVAIYEWCHGNLHAKTAVVDGIWGTVGSFNLERMSFRFNYEVNVAFADPALGGALEASFRKDCQMCTAIDLTEWRRRPFWQRVVERTLYLFRKVI
jgi:cardiolipin synthase